MTALDAAQTMPVPFLGRDKCRLPERTFGKLSGLSRNALLNVVAECLDDC